MLATYQLRTRIRMYLLVTLVCGLSALMLQWFLAGADEFRNYAERQLDGAVRAAVHDEVSRMATENNR